MYRSRVIFAAVSKGVSEDLISSVMKVADRSRSNFDGDDDQVVPMLAY